MPSGVIATASGAPPTEIAAPATFVAVVIGVTEAPAVFATNAVAPFGVIATPAVPGPAPVAIAAPATPVDTFTGVTVLAVAFAT